MLIEVAEDSTSDQMEIAAKSLKVLLKKLAVDLPQLGRISTQMP